jgi:hypothetical protein
VRGAVAGWLLLHACWILPPASPAPCLGLWGWLAGYSCGPVYSAAAGAVPMVLLWGLATAAAVAVLVAGAAGCEYTAHPHTIGPRTEQHKRDKYQCKATATCVAEASRVCNDAPNCSSFGLSAAYGRGLAVEFYSTPWNMSYGNAVWTLYSCSTDQPPPSRHPPPHGGGGGGGTQRGHGHSSRPAAAPPDVDCAVRKLALEYAQRLIPRAVPDVFRGLELGAMCGVAPPPPPPPAAALGRHHLSGGEVVVDPRGGSDREGDGTAVRPVATLGEALRLTRLRSPVPEAAQARGCVKTIALKGGIHYLNETMKLGVADSGTCIVGVSGENATISGGMELHLTWTKSKTVAEAWEASLPAGVPRFDQLFVGGRREIRAKYRLHVIVCHHHQNPGLAEFHLRFAVPIIPILIIPILILMTHAEQVSQRRPRDDGPAHEQHGLHLRLQLAQRHPPGPQPVQHGQVHLQRQPAGRSRLSRVQDGLRRPVPSVRQEPQLLGGHPTPDVRPATSAGGQAIPLEQPHHRHRACVPR